MNTSVRKYPDGQECSEFVIQNGEAQMTIDLQGGYVTGWNVGKKAILYNGSSKKRTGIPILFPYFGKSTKGKQHGFGRDSQWRLVSSSDTELVIELTEKDISEEAKKEYPFAFRVAITITLEPTGFTYRLDVEDTNGHMLPISPGLHPYWAVPHAQKKEVKVDGLDFDASTTDWDTNPPDVLFLFNGKATFQFPDKTLVIEDMGEQKNIKYIVVWSQTPDKPDSNFICFEPVCGENGGYDITPIMVKDTWSMQVRFSIK